MQRRLHRGLEVFELESPHESFKRSYGSTLVPVEADPEERPGSDPLPVDPEKQWIKIQVIDDETGKPVSGIPLELLLPGRSAKEYKTDANNGRISISDISAGTCDIVKMTDDEAWEVVSVS